MTWMPKRNFPSEKFHPALFESFWQLLVVWWSPCREDRVKTAFVAICFDRNIFVVPVKTMRNYFRLLKYIKNYQGYAWLHVLSNLLSVIFSLVSLTMIIPFLNILF